MRQDQSLPPIWLVSDARNDAQLEKALARLPRASGFIYRHYHLSDPERWERFIHLRRIAKRHGHVVILADSALTAREWGADGIYGAPRALTPRRLELLKLASAHNMREMALANRLGADAVLLSPVFATRSHPGAPHLGRARFRLLTQRAHMPVIALGGLTHKRARALDWRFWAAIDGLS